LDARVEWQTSIYGESSCNLRRSIGFLLVNLVVHRYFDRLTTFRQLTTASKIEDTSSTILRAFRVAKGCYSITSSQGGAGRDNLQVPGAISCYLSSIRPDKPFSLLQPTTLHHTLDYRVGKQKRRRSMICWVNVTSHIKPLWPPCLQDRKALEHTPSSTPTTRSLRHTCTRTSNTKPYFFCFSG